MSKKTIIWLMIFSVLLVGISTFSTYVYANANANDDSKLEFSKDYWNFDFGSGEVEPGYTKVNISSTYSESLGYGFLDVTNITEADRGKLTPLLSDFCSSTDMSFDVDLPNGNYKVIVYSGDADTTGLTSTRVYAEGLLQTVGIGERTGKVGEADFPIKVKDSKLNLRFTGSPAYLNGLRIIKNPDSCLDKRPTIFIASDSTAQSYNSYAYPQTGWGQVLDKYLTDEVLIDNHAIGGRSSKSYILEGSLDTILSRSKPNDFLLIQFGHNDASTIPERHTDAFGDYKTYLGQYIDKARENGITPILITPVGRRSYNSDGKFKNDFPDYCTAMKEVSIEKNVQIIDLMSKSIAYYNTVGVEKSKSIFLWLAAGQYPNFPNGISDDTHFQEYGANQIAKIVANSFVEDKIISLSDYVKK